MFVDLMLLIRTNVCLCNLYVAIIRDGDQTGIPNIIIIQAVHLKELILLYPNILIQQNEFLKVCAAQIEYKWEIMQAHNIKCSTGQIKWNVFRANTIVQQVVDRNNHNMLVFFSILLLGTQNIDYSIADDNPEPSIGLVEPFLQNYGSNCVCELGRCWCCNDSEHKTKRRKTEQFPFPCLNVFK